MSELRAIGSFAKQIKRVNDGNSSTADVYSVTKYDGFVRSLDYFKKQVFSRDLSSYKIVRKGEFAYSTIHLDEGALGLLEDKQVLISPMYTTFQVDESVDRQYIAYLLKSPDLVAQYSLIGQGSINRRKSVAFSSLAELEVFIPPLPEQKKIAEILSGIDSAIATLERKRAKSLQAIEKTVNEFVYTKMQGCLGIENMSYGVIDGDRGAEYPKEDDFYPKGHCLFLSAKNVTKEGFNFDRCEFITKEKDDALRKGRLSEGDLVITTRGTLGNVAHFNNGMPAKSIRINSGMAVIRAERTRDPEVERFIFFCIQSEFLQSQIATASFGTAQNQLTLGIIRNLRFPFFAKEDRNSFVAICEAIAKYKSHSSEKIRKQYQLKNALSSDLLSGRKRVTV